MNKEIMNIFNPAAEGPTFDRIRARQRDPDPV